MFAAVDDDFTTAGVGLDLTGADLTSSLAGVGFSLVVTTPAFASGAAGGAWFVSDDAGGAVESRAGAAGALVVAAPLNGIGALTGAVR